MDRMQILPTNQPAEEETTTPMSERIHILSIGEMERRVDENLAGRFLIYSDQELGLENIAAKHGAEIAAIITRGRVRTTAHLIERLPKLELIAHFGVGYDSVDVAEAARRGVVITNTPDVLTDEVADYSVGLLLATIRRLPQADRHVRSGLYGQGKQFHLTASLRDRTIGIAGMGRIGQAIAHRLAAFNVPLAYFARHPKPELPYPCYNDLSALAKAVDTLILVLPGGPATKKIVDAEVLSALGLNGILINVARGSVVDERALIEALQSGTILAAGLDVYEKEPHVPAELLQMDQVVLLPHTGSGTHYTRGRMGELVIANVLSWFDGKGPITPVPETPFDPQRYGRRAAFASKATSKEDIL
jgi:lactate dehydrogenase-like 2-hydroxyacid dehydrogenase